MGFDNQFGSSRTALPGRLNFPDGPKGPSYILVAAPTAPARARESNQADVWQLDPFPTDTGLQIESIFDFAKSLESLRIFGFLWRFFGHL